MATKPTREQARAFESLAESLVQVCSAARLDGGSRFGRGDLEDLVRCLSRATSAFPSDELISLALRKRCVELGLRLSRPI